MSYGLLRRRTRISDKPLTGYFRELYQCYSGGSARWPDNNATRQEQRPASVQDKPVILASNAARGAKWMETADYWAGFRTFQFHTGTPSISCYGLNLASENLL